MPDQPQMPGQEDPAAETPKKGGMMKYLLWIVAIVVVGYVVVKYLL